MKNHIISFYLLLFSYIEINNKNLMNISILQWKVDRYDFDAKNDRESYI